MRYRLTLISETLWSHSSIYLNILYLLQRNANRFCVSQRRCQSFPADSATNSSNEFNRLFATRSVSKWVLNRVEVPDVEPRRCRAISIDSNRVSVDIRVSGRPGRQAISRTDLPPSSAKSVFPFGKTRSKKSSFFVQLSRVCFFFTILFARMTSVLERGRDRIFRQFHAVYRYDHVASWRCSLMVAFHVCFQGVDVPLRNDLLLIASFY